MGLKMSGYLGGDCGAINAQAIIDDNIALTISLIPRGDSLRRCLECDEAIPEPRRLALPGVKTCIPCQINKDKRRPKIIAVTKML
ncbi:Zinc finger, DksA/TraR C4-type [uncultured Caudovirales phage]|uniref:Zinc finger, DksA/TraR C4-type n=1 Tax=uncultured Caudovirales phage TaxID=2100421 RepID=A0A6J5L1J7_9CAUD|nr:Zinc finger, DksA/TraR C4-type [uncultured Caudovirales phage]